LDFEKFKCLIFVAESIHVNSFLYQLLFSWALIILVHGYLGVSHVICHVSEYYSVIICWSVDAVNNFKFDIL
jgi:hypothetical protein